MTRIRTLPARRHAVYRLAPDLLLVFKPRGHVEAEHAHPHRQRLRVLSGRLDVRVANRIIRLGANSRTYTLGANRSHTTVARTDTWLIAETRQGQAPWRAARRRRRGGAVVGPARTGSRRRRARSARRIDAVRAFRRRSLGPILAP